MVFGKSCLLHKRRKRGTEMRKKWEYIPIATKAESRTEQVKAAIDKINKPLRDMPDDATIEQMALMLKASTNDMLREINISLAIIADHLTNTDGRK